MAWTKSSAGGFTKYVQTLGTGANHTITLSGAGCVILTAADVVLATADAAGSLNDSYDYENLVTTVAGQEYTVPSGSHILKATDVSGGGAVTVWVSKNAAAQSETVVSVGGIGADPS